MQRTHQEQQKVCPKCHIEKPSTDFGLRMHRGRRVLQSYCRRCMVVATTAWQKANPERWKALEARSKARYPERISARRKAQAAVARGRLQRQPCERCGHPDVEAHHPDYSKPLDVVWLCHTHHGEASRVAV